MKDVFKLTTTLALLALLALPSSAVVYVKKDSPFPHPIDGESWETAFSTIQEGINAAETGEEVWVAKGVYTECVTISRSVQLYGGFAGTETTRDQRDRRVNQTIIDGNRRGSAVWIKSGYDVTVDGFTVRNGVGSRAGGIQADAMNPIISNNIVVCNEGTYTGGIFCGNAGLITGNVVKGNDGEIQCGGVTGHGGVAGICYIINNTIINNSGSQVGGIDCNFYSVVANNLVAYNSSGLRCTGSSAEIVSNNFYQNEAGDFLNIPSVIGTNGNISAEPKLASTAFGDAHLMPDSPCINAGNDSKVQPDWQDMDGEARAQGAHVDIGADEFNGTAPVFSPRIIRVSPLGIDMNDGSSWQLAKQSVRSAVNEAIDGDSPFQQTGAEIWVAAGTYYEHVDVPSYVYLYGGFSGVESARSQRDWRTNETILDGGNFGPIVGFDAPDYRTNSIDGFTIRNGKSYNGYGGGIYSVCASPIIANNKITSNSSTIFGGGIYCADGHPIITGNIITGNSSSRDGGGLYCSCFSLTLENNDITHNSADNNGGGVSCVSPQFPGVNKTRVIKHNIIAHNTAAQGGGIYCYDAAISSNIISGNNASVSGGGVYSEHVTNLSCNVIAGNNAPNGGAVRIGLGSTISNTVAAFNSSGFLYNGDTPPTLKSNCVYGNTAYNFSGLSVGPTDISADPLFADKASGDYHLLPGSPCIDKGDPTAAPSVDMDGVPVPKDGDGDGTSKPDIGCYECPGNYTSLAAVKTLMDGTPVGISAAISTAIFSDKFYLELASRACGIGILDSCPSTGRYATIEGVVSTIQGEKMIIPASIVFGGSTASPGPLFISPGMLDAKGIGLSTTGLLIKTAGRVRHTGSLNFFYLDQIKVDWPFSSAMPADGAFVEMEAISSCTLSGTEVVKMLRPVAPQKVRVIAE